MIWSVELFQFEDLEILCRKISQTIGLCWFEQYQQNNTYKK